MSTAEFSELLLVNSTSLKPFAVSLTKDKEVAKDLFQETLYKAFANREKYTTGTNIKAWLYTIMRNIFINDYRRNAKYKTKFNSGDDDNLLDSVAPAIDNPAESSMQHKKIWEAINKLPEIFKSPFLLNFEGYRYHEIAEAMQEPLGTIKSRIFIARKLLKESISRY
jgi:RNA polymerase sigma factor (sigma-70 family)